LVFVSRSGVGFAVVQAAVLLPGRDTLDVSRTTRDTTQ
jgi:hypothetical protein